MSSATTTPPAPPAPPATVPGPRRPRLSGMTWLIWRQHRAAFWTVLLATAAAVAWMLHQRAGLLDHLTSHGWPHASPDKWLEGMEPYRAETLKAGLGLLLVPVIAGVFLGAPLLAGDLESGTAKLVTTQVASPARWLAAKIGVTVPVVVVSTVALSLVCDAWWTPLTEQDGRTGWDLTVFTNTGPVPVALTVLTVLGGAAIGMVLRRTLLSMVVTFFFAVAVEVVWAMHRLDFAEPLRIVSRSGHGGSAPAVPAGGLEVDQSYLTGSGHTLPLSTCIHEPSAKAAEVCFRQKDVVGHSVDYLPLSQLSTTQWLDASVLFALAAGVAVFILLRGRKRVV
ncbi:ABC transporter [Actinacidiphila glaucinigra]|uniref:ABC transporter n=1 Tax=Actinacidiphila glaucinigra TaxID=235986 RepID=UPI0035E0ECD5